MNFNIIVHDWGKDLSEQELLIRLADLKYQADRHLPILDDDDLETAIEEAAARISPHW